MTVKKTPSLAAQSAKSLSPNTTAQDDMVVAAQRRINLIWEVTQSVIAVVVTISTMGMGIYIVVDGKQDSVIPTIFSVGFGMIIGFYFNRTNHEKQGGIGQKTGRR